MSGREDALVLALATYSVQILLIVAVAACAAAIVRMRAPWFRLFFWRMILLLCLLLPLAPPRVVDADIATVAEVGAVVAGPTQPVAAVPTVSPAAAVLWPPAAR